MTHKKVVDESKAHDYLKERGFDLKRMKKVDLWEFVTKLSIDMVQREEHIKKIANESLEHLKELQGAKAEIIKHQDTIDALLMSLREINANMKGDVTINFRYHNPNEQERT